MHLPAFCLEVQFSNLLRTLSKANISWGHLEDGLARAFLARMALVLGICQNLMFK
jgi:hypothetical protein